LLAISKSRAQHPQKMSNEVPAKTTASQRKKKCANLWKSEFYGAFVLNRRVVLHAIDATPAR
jgi:hypothetical protein